MSTLEELSGKVIRERGGLPTQHVILKHASGRSERLKPMADTLGGAGTGETRGEHN